MPPSSEEQARAGLWLVYQAIGQVLAQAGGVGLQPDAVAARLGLPRDILVGNSGTLASVLLKQMSREGLASYRGGGWYGP